MLRNPARIPTRPTRNLYTVRYNTRTLHMPSSLKVYVERQAVSKNAKLHTS